MSHVKLAAQSLKAVSTSRCWLLAAGCWPTRRIRNAARWITFGVQRLKMPLNGVPKQKAKLSMHLFFFYFLLFAFFTAFSVWPCKWNGNSVESVALLTLKAQKSGESREFRWWSSWCQKCLHTTENAIGHCRQVASNQVLVPWVRTHLCFFINQPLSMICSN